MPWSPQDDPLTRLARPLAGVLIAVAASLLIAAMIGGAMPLEYTGRAVTFIALLLYVIVGAVLVFRAAYAGEDQSLTPARVGKWIVSIWLWPVLALGGRGRVSRDEP